MNHLAIGLTTTAALAVAAWAFMEAYERHQARKSAMSKEINLFPDLTPEEALENPFIDGEFGTVVISGEGGAEVVVADGEARHLFEELRQRLLAKKEPSNAA